MAFSDYKHIAQVQQEYQISYQEAHFLVAPIKIPSPHFIAEFTFNLDNIDVYSSEASRSEMIIGPILRELYKDYYQNYSLWVQKSISYNERLTGTPDYMIAKRSGLGKTVLEFPLVLATEAKQNNFTQGWGQCAAELVAAQRLNGEASRPVYGIVTDGKLWEFGRLRDQSFIKESEGFTSDHLDVLFGVLALLFQAATTGHDLCA